MNILLNGVGRIGKSILRIIEKENDLNLIAINEINTNIKNIAYSINYDSTYGRIEDSYKYDEKNIFNKKNTIQIFNENNLTNIDFSQLNIDYIIDASGREINSEDLRSIPVKAIFITHPNKNADINVILGVNEKELNSSHKIISTSSCNATALMPLLQLLDNNFSITMADIVTIHPLLNHQKTLDSNCIGSSDRGIECNFEFGRSATQNIIPSKTTTVKACSYVNSKFNHDLISSNSLRVPTPTVGAINLTCLLEKEISITNIQNLLENYIRNQEHHIIFCNNEELVSSDFQSSKYTTIVDMRYIQVIKKNFVKFLIWYDNEYGYASKVIDILKLTKGIFK